MIKNNKCIWFMLGLFFMMSSAMNAQKKRNENTKKRVSLH